MSLGSSALGDLALGELPAAAASTAGFWLPDPRFEMPELFEPNGKPNGKVVIDRDHPIGKKIFHCFLHQPVGKDLLDIAKGRLWSPCEGDTNNVNSFYPMPPYGVCSHQDATTTARCGWGGNDNDFEKELYDYQTDNRTISSFQIVRYLGDGTTGIESGLWSTNDQNSSGYQVLTYNTTELEDNEWHTVGYSHTRGTNNTLLYFDGVLVYTGNFAFNPDALRVRYKPSTDNIEMGGFQFSSSSEVGLCIGNQYQNNDDGWQGDIALSVFCDHMLSDAEHLYLHQHPFEYLIPA